MLIGHAVLASSVWLKGVLIPLFPGVPYARTDTVARSWNLSRSAFHSGPVRDSESQWLTLGLWRRVNERFTRSKSGFAYGFCQLPNTVPGTLDSRAWSNTVNVSHVNNGIHLQLAHDVTCFVFHSLYPLAANLGGECITFIHLAYVTVGLFVLLVT